ncbi:MAG: hypothetical protein M1820_007643 [Bogoriella megaspora]|nr:MAG: hypothetical protein M1820_007643 [Bogoriella megaspora]
MNPKMIAARTKYMQPKPSADPQERTSFQKQLSENPYAQALATPVRTCRITGVRLPSYFHLQFHDILPPARNPSNTSTDQGTSGKNPPSTPWTLPLRLHHLTHPAPPSTTPNAVPWSPKGQSTTLLARRSVLRYLNNTGIRKRVLRGGGRIWRGDMEDYVLKLMREAVVKKGWWGVKKGWAEEVRLTGPDGSGKGGWEGAVDWGEGRWVKGLQEVDNVGCVLFLRPVIRKEIREVEREINRRMGEVVRVVEKVLALEHEIMIKRVTRDGKLGKVKRSEPKGVNVRALFPRLEVPMVEWRGERVPVYDLVEMLGEEKMGELVGGSRVEGASCVVLKKGYFTSSVQMWLGKLWMYVADDTEMKAS